MRPTEDIKNLINKMKDKTSEQMDKRILDDVLKTLDKSTTTASIRGLILKSPILKLAVAAMIAIAIIIGLKGFNDTSAWAEVVEQFSQVNDIHITSKRSISKTGEEDEYQWWIKNGKLTRSDDEDSTHIVNGARQLWLLHEEKTARFDESKSDEQFEWTLLKILRGEKLNYPTEIKSIGNDDVLIVYEIKEHISYEEIAIVYNVWVDPNKKLPIKISGEQIEQDTNTVRLKFESTCDYEPIPLEMFDLVVPPGYTDITNLESARLSGMVIDENNQPVADAEIISAEDIIRGKTDQQGEFTIKLYSGRTLKGFPLIVRAIKNDDPNHVAWTLLRNPRHELRPLSIPDDGKTKLEDGDGVSIFLFDETTLRKFIPDNSGTMIFKSDDDKYPFEIKDIIIKMQPASEITGRITDRNGQPIHNAIVWLDNLEVSVGENKIWIDSIGRTDKEKEIALSLSAEDFKKVGGRSFAITDHEGYYKLCNIPDIWYRARLEVKADGYVQEAKEISQNEGNDFALLKADVIVRGTVIDDQGNPVIGREVEIDVDSDEIGDLNIEEFCTDSEGKFELKGIPEVDGLKLEIRTDKKPYDWDENELTRGHEFVYYRMIEEEIKFEPGKKEYTVNIVPHKPDIELRIEVKDKQGKSLEGIPIGICSPGYSERIWYTTKLCGVTDENGICIIEEAPRNEPLELWICKPEEKEHYWNAESDDVNQKVLKAISETGSKYFPVQMNIDWQEDKKNYTIPITLEAIE